MSLSDERDRSTPVREAILEPLRRVLEWLLSLRDARGRIVCPEHRIEHSGKNAGVIVIALELAELDPRADVAACKRVAIEQGRRLAANLEREGTSECFTFRPGRHDPYNCSNSVIDGGACADALATLVTRLGGELDEEDRRAFEGAARVHARTYLSTACLDKGVPAQRAWGLTGLAAVQALWPEERLEPAGLEAVRLLAEVQHEGGSYPYHPLEWGALHAGASDVSAFYQSRVTGFLLHALETLGHDPASETFADPLRRGLDFLCALHGPGGTKCGLVEAKPWYWGATYEVASHPFDVHALARGWRHFGDERYADVAAAAFEAWVSHLDLEGRPRSHRPAPGRRRSYQCPVFWAGHAMWLARVARDLEAILARPSQRERPPFEAVRVFEGASLVRLESEHLVAWVRGARPGYNVAHGSPHGAGLLGVRRKRDGAELLSRAPLAARQAGEWSGEAGGLRLARGWSAGQAELRFSTWLARAHWRAHRWLEGAGEPWRALRRGVLAFASPRVSSAFALDPEVAPLSDGVRLRSHLAWRGGEPVPGTELLRTFRLAGDTLCVQERLIGSGAVRDLDYTLPPLATSVERRRDEISWLLR